MKVILQDKVANLGAVGDQVKVRPGYARNFLIPTGRAVRATAANLENFERRRAEFEKRAADILAAAKARAEKIAVISVKLTANASEEGKLFGSIGPREIAEAVSAQGEALNKSEVHLPEGPIRELGEYQVDVQLHSDVMTTIKVEIVAE